MAVIEVKRTRADLLADLKRKKMLKYERGSTHCYLAATPEALMLHKWDKAKVLNSLKDKGLPSHWGILILQDGAAPTCLRGARRHHTTNAQRIYALTRKIAKSYCYRTLGGQFENDLPATAS